MSEPATTTAEAISQMLEYAERQVFMSEDGYDYASRRFAEEGPINRPHYQTEMDRCRQRAAYFRPHVAVLKTLLVSGVFSLADLDKALGFEKDAAA